jgi:hypothetical protein
MRCYAEEQNMELQPALVFVEDDWKDRREAGCTYLKILSG